MIGPVEVRLARGAVRTADGCLTWQKARNLGGYGLIYSAGRVEMAHRVAWELANGPIPDDLTVDHLCRTKACVDPAHMEIVTRAENSRRGSPNTDKTHCKHGHELAGDNVYAMPDGRRGCRTCRRRVAAESNVRRRGRARSRTPKNVRAASAGEQRGSVSSPAGRPLPVGELTTPTPT